MALKDITLGQYFPCLLYTSGHQGQEDGYAGPLHADATLQQGAEGGQAGQQDGGEAAGHLAPDATQAGLQIQTGPDVYKRQAYISICLP